MKQDLLTDDELAKMFKASRQPAPPHLADMVMMHLPEARPLPEELKKPLISKAVWLLLAAMFIGLVGLVIYLSPTSVAGTPYGATNQLKEVTTSANRLLQSSVLLYCTIISVGGAAFLVLDRLLHRKLLS